MRQDDFNSGAQRGAGLSYDEKEGSSYDNKADSSYDSKADPIHESDAQVSAVQVWKAFAGYYKPYLFLFFMDLLCATVLAAVDLAFPQLLNFFTRDFFQRDASVILSALGWILLAFAALYLVRTGCQYFITCWGHIMGARMEADMRRDLFEQYQRLSFDYYDRHNTGAMMSKITNDLFDISELAHHGPENLFICVLKIVGSFVLLMTINVPLTLMMLLATAVMATYSFWRNYQKSVIFKENRARMASVNATVQDSLGGIRVVKSFGGEHAENVKFGHANEAFLDTKVRSYEFMGQFHAANSLFMGVLYTVTVVGGGYYVAHGTLEPSQLIMYALYIGIFISPVEQLVNFTETLQKGYAGFRRFMEVLAEAPSVADAPDARPLGQVRGEVRYEDVCFDYEEGTPVLRQFSLQVPAGQTVALVGPSGGGKTTACSLLPRFYDPKAGRITIDGTDIRTVGLESLRDAIGIVQQDVFLFGGTVRDNIAYGRPDATDAEIEQAARRANIHEFACSLPQGYDTLVGERGARLSGGQKQRVAIARVFLRDPRILILDEATSALDNENEAAVQRSLAELSQGRTTIVIAHRLSTIRNASRIAVVEDGHVAEVGTHDDLIVAGGTYARYYAMQFGKAE